jgi:hypothetical protein
MLAAVSRPRPSWRRPATCALGLVVLAIGTAPAAGAMSILYDGNADGSVTAIVRGDRTTTGLGGARVLFRQEPSRDHLLRGDADAPRRLAKVSARDLIGKPAPRIAGILADAIDGSCPPAGCASHMVAVDEISARFADGRDEGTQLRDALVLLSERPYRGGGTYAERTHFYLGPGVVTAIGYGLGPDHDLGRNGVTKRTGYVTIMEGLAHAGGVWMYRPGNVAAGATYPLERQAWKSGPRDIAQLIVRFGGSLDRVHLLMSNPGLPASFPSLPGGGRTSADDHCTTMACQWALATDPSTLNPRLVANGVGEYALASSALGLDWLRGYHAAMAKRLPARSDADWIARFAEPESAVGEDRPVERVGKPRKPRPGVAAVTLRAPGRARVAFRIGARYRRHRTVTQGSQDVTFPIPRCGSCARMKVRIVTSGTTYDTFRIAALSADRLAARR